MRLATWNVNSLNVRLPHLLEWLQTNQPDILGLQEIKLETQKFPLEAIEAAGYKAIVQGQKTYNGVAILYKPEYTPATILTQLPGMEDDPQARFIAATFGDVRFIDIYVPNGAEVGSEKFHYKLKWLAALVRYIKQAINDYPKLAIVGDFNIAPEDQDVHDPKAWEGSVLVSPQERDFFQQVLALGLKDSFRLFDQPAQTFSWWDYRAAAFVRNHGLRIDHILLSSLLATQCQSCVIDTTPRKLERPSDHAPVISTIL